MEKLASAAALARQARDARADERVRSFSDRWEARRLGAEQINGGSR